MQKCHRILAVDDSPINLAVLEEMLDGPYALRCAGSGEEAITVARDFRPDIVLLDIMMPGIGGFETCARLRKDPGLRHVKIIMLSARTEVADRLRGYDVGADDFISKPFNHEELLAKIAVFLRLKNVEELDSLKSDILMLLNHETRTPLNGILGALQLLADSDNCGAPSDQELIHFALKSGQRLERLIRKGLLYAEVRSGRAKFAVQSVGLGGLLEAVIAAHTPRATEAGVPIVLRAASPLTVTTDPGHLKFVLESLLENAIGHSVAPAPVVVEMTGNAGHVELSVTDCGPGIAPSVLPRLFDGFTAEDLAHHSEGHGLSLAICKEILERLGGSLAVDATYADGARFRAVLPVDALDPDEEAREPQLITNEK